MHVSKNDFRPPPQVESSVIRLVPIDPPPLVKFEEFDGLNRIIFSRPNKTVRGNFQAKGVMKMLEQNRRTWLAAQEKVRCARANCEPKNDVCADDGGRHPDGAARRQRAGAGGPYGESRG